MLKHITILGLLLFGFVAWSVFVTGEAPDWLYKIGNWDYDFKEIYEYLKSWANYQIIRFGFWGYVFLGVLFLILGFSSEVTRGTVTLLVSHGVRSVMSLIFTLFSLLSLSSLVAIYKAAMSQFIRIIRSLRG